MGSASGDSGDPPPALVLCGPSGAGKSTLMKLLTSEFRDQFGFSVSHTTRSPRPGEQQGKDYHFASRVEIEVLEMRLRERGTENEASLARRLEAARGELEYGRAEGNFDLRLVNDQVEKAYAQLREFMLPTLAKLKEEGTSGEKVI